ncbi:hypothetical protein PAECIP111893_01270 [Paenibacillus plantiphilus]|uniref:DUF4399 domain-containing protein n=1 Tax=Paenibacillus plantiphilus TaxID=2905650 RepID=A0ABM9C0U6_9BACL|nr:hypothetical protein [Paenibacillus plantiphilus]CAH1199229.1 hypothetical protein PAECIP111893_01270 [Paenibacillus plantiphilus]
MIKKQLVVLSLSVLCIIMIGCGNNTASDPSHNQHAAQSDPAVQPASTPPAGEAAYSLDATAYEEKGTFYIKAVTDLKLSSEHYGGEPVDGEGHIHVYLDGKLLGPIKDAAPFPLQIVEPGTYAIKLVLAENNHTESFGVSKELSVEQKE